MSGGGGRIVAALKQYGLMQDEGKGDQRRVQLTDLARRILLDQRPDSVERREGLKRAALNPKIHCDLWERYGSDFAVMDEAQIRHDLIFGEKRFNEEMVDGFIAQFKSTVEFAGLSKSDTLSGDKDVDAAPSHDEEQEEGVEQLEVGDYVQWESEGAWQFETPRCIRGLDGDWAFVEGSPTGIPVSELSKATPPPPAREEAMAQEQVVRKDVEAPPPNPFFEKQAKPPDKPGVTTQKATYPLDEGHITLEWPEPLSRESVQEFKDWLRLVTRKVERKAGLEGEHARTEQGAEAPDTSSNRHIDMSLR